MLKIKVKKGNIERALKDYKSKVIKTRQMRRINDKKEYEKNFVNKRKEIKKGKYKEKKRREDD
jgi:ribosomal protein S21